VLAVGSVVSLQLPLGGPQGPVDMLGRVTALVPPRQIVIALDQPWRGQLRVGLERIGPESTRVRVRAEVDERGVEWLLRRRGWPARQPADDDGDYRIGLLTSKSGPGADLVLSTLVGADEVAFERQCLAMGLRARCRTLSLVLDESTRERIGDAAAAGLWTAFGYFQQLPTAENRAFLARYRDAFGPCAPPVSTLSESTYSAVHLYGAAARRARTIRGG